ncbi:MAG: monovalent cation/H+ antiporter subunit D family protein, partial [Corynebacterium sp.]|nr:monovalent cation/H+ antiporter subunit D family protein [Corynebacterium sp.]
FDLDPTWNWLIVALMVVSMLIGGFAGLAENSIRRVLAYQMVNGMPFILVMLAFTSEDPQRALAAGLLYTLHHMITVGALILTSGAIEETYGTGLLSKLSGLARRDPWVAAVFAAGAFSVVGFPPFSGLWGKAFIVLGIARDASVWSWIVIAAIVIASFGALLSMIRVWREVFWGGSITAHGVSPALRVSPAKIAPATALMVLSVAMFLLAGPLIDATLTATAGLLDTTGYMDAVLGDEAVGVPSPNYTGGN